MLDLLILTGCLLIGIVAATKERNDYRHITVSFSE